MNVLGKGERKTESSRGGREGNVRGGSILRGAKMESKKGVGAPAGGKRIRGEVGGGRTREGLRGAPRVVKQQGVDGMRKRDKENNEKGGQGEDMGAPSEKTGERMWDREVKRDLQ